MANFQYNLDYDSDYRNLENTIRTLGFNPNHTLISNFWIHLKKTEMPLSEKAMLLAHVVHETAGFTALREPNKTISYDDLQYLGNLYNSRLKYYGRGYLHLTWASNYRQASWGLGMGDRLLINPELVCNDLDIAAKTAIWFWKTKVKHIRVFSDTTRVINPIECDEPELERAKRRYFYYLKIAKAFSIANPIEEGDYSRRVGKSRFWCCF